MSKTMSSIVNSYKGNVLYELFDKEHYIAGDHLLIRNASSGLIIDSDRVLLVVNIVETDDELTLAKTGTTVTVDIRTYTCWRFANGAWSSAPLLTNNPYVWGGLVQSPITNKTYRVNNDMTVTLVSKF